MCIVYVSDEKIKNKNAVLLLRHIPQRSQFPGNAKVVHKCTHEKKKWNKFSIQIVGSPIPSIQILYSNTTDLVVCLVCVFLHRCVFVWVHMCTTALMHAAVNRARIFVCSYSVSIINSRKLIQFIAFTYWPESLLQGGIMADWVCTKTGGEKERESKKEREKMETYL